MNWTEQSRQYVSSAYTPDSRLYVDKSRLNTHLVAHDRVLLHPWHEIQVKMKITPADGRAGNLDDGVTLHHRRQVKDEGLLQLQASRWIRLRI